MHHNLAFTHIPQTPAVHMVVLVEMPLLCIASSCLDEPLTLFHTTYSSEICVIAHFFALVINDHLILDIQIFPTGILEAFDIQYFYN